MRIHQLAKRRRLVNYEVQHVVIRQVLAVFVVYASNLLDPEEGLLQVRLLHHILDSLTFLQFVVEKLGDVLVSDLLVGAVFVVEGRQVEYIPNPFFHFRLVT